MENSTDCEEWVLVIVVEPDAANGDEDDFDVSVPNGDDGAAAADEFIPNGDVLRLADENGLNGDNTVVFVDNAAAPLGVCGCDENDSNGVAVGVVLWSFFTVN